LSEAPESQDPSAQLETLKRRLSEANPELYRHLALYLQVLRQVLPHRVRQACFHLATQVHPQRYADLPAERRQLLHQQIERLVSRCSSLLTVEHLAILADQIDRERQRRQRQEQQQMVEEFSWDNDEAQEGSPQPDSLPPGSVRLSLAPPLSGAAFPWGQFLAAQAHLLPADGESPGPQDGGAIHPDLGEDADVPEDSGTTRRADNQTLALALAATATHQDDASEPEQPDGASAPSLWRPGPLPEEPQQVLQWLDGMELALARRLRNLSHAINVELLRAGVNRSLLPVSLLDAVLAGQLDTMAAPANLIRLPLPFGDGPRPSQPQTMAVLLRAMELELEEPRLRTCRRRLQQHRQEVRRMAQQFRRLQRRLRIHQAEQLWLQDTRPTPNPSD
jgi:hypothetical protein